MSSIKQVKRGSQYFWLSLLEKQSESGITFNHRTLFLGAHNVLGYLRQGDSQVLREALNFEEAKVTVSLKAIVNAVAE